MKKAGVIIIGLCSYFAVEFCLAQTAPSSPQAQIEKTRQLLHHGKLQEAQDALINLEHIDAKILKVELTMRDDLDDAEDEIEELLEQYPKEPDVHFMAGRIMGIQASNAVFSALSYAKKSLKGFQKAVQLAPDNIKYQRGLMQFHLNAPSIAGGDIEVAKSQAEKIFALDPAAGLRARIEVSRVAQDEDKHQQYLNTLIAEHADVPRVWYEAGLFAQQNEHFSQAFEKFDKGISLSEGNALSDGNNLPKENHNIEYCLSLYQYGRTAIFAEENINEGIKRISNYLSSCDVAEDELPASEWAEFRLANLYELDQQIDNAKGIYRRLIPSTDDNLNKELSKKSKKLLLNP